MDAPFWIKITFKTLDLVEMRQQLRPYPLGRKPFLLNLHPVLNSQEAEEQFLHNLQEIFREWGIHPRIPYPIYVLSQFVIHSGNGSGVTTTSPNSGTLSGNNIPLVEHEKFLPRHFTHPPHIRLSAAKYHEKDLKHYNQTRINVLKLNNLQIHDQLEEIQVLALQNKALSRLYRENQFYLQLLEQLGGNKK